MRKLNLILFAALVFALSPIPSAFAAISKVEIANVGSPPDDPLLIRRGTLYVPDPAVHPPPWHTVVGTRAGGFTDGGLGNLDQPFTELAQAGYLCLAFEVRLAKEGAQGGLPGQVTDGKWKQQTDDFKAAVRSMRSNPYNKGYQVTGFVGGLGGSGSGHHVVYCALDGTSGDDKLDAGIAMSPATDFSDREPSTNLAQFVQKVENYGRTTDIPTLFARSPIALPLANAKPLWHANGDAENMPLSQLTRFRVAMANAGAQKYTWVLNTGDCGGLFAGCGGVHAFGIWDFRGTEATTWLNARAAEWAAVPTPTPTPSSPSRIVIGPRKPSATPTPPIEIPNGLYYLPSAQTLSDQVIGNPNVDGVVVGSSWSDIEPTQGVYDFDTVASGQSLDSQIAQVEAKGKKIKLQVQVGGPNKAAGGHKPEWLYAAITADSYTGGKFFSFKSSQTETTTVPVFWEPTLLSVRAAMMQAVATHVAGHPSIISVQVSYVNCNSNDWNPCDIDNNVDGVPPTNSTPQTRWVTTLTGSGFATFEAACKSAGNSTFASMHTSFPNMLLATPIGRVENITLNPGGQFVQGRNIAGDVVNTAEANWPGHVAAQKQNLNGGGVTPAPGGTSAWNDLYVLAVPHGAQMVWSAYNDCTDDSSDPMFNDLWAATRMNHGFGSPCIDSTDALKQAIDLGKGYNTKWQEIYELDLKNLGATNGDPRNSLDCVKYAHDTLFTP